MLHRALEVDDSILVVIDAQAAFLKKLPPQENERLLDRICWLIRVAHCLGVPLVVTERFEGSQHYAVCVRNMFEEERASALSDLTVKAA